MTATIAVIFLAFGLAVGTHAGKNDAEQENPVVQEEIK